MPVSLFTLGDHLASGQIKGGQQGQGSMALILVGDTLQVSQAHFWRQQLIMHLGRICTYLLLGALAGGVGAAVWHQDVIALQRPLFVVASAILIFLGLKLIFRGTARPRVAGLWFGGHLARIWAQYLGRQASTPARWFSGMLWGLVPCGLVYSILPLAFLFTKT